jgi:hypothetical protein
MMLRQRWAALLGALLLIVCGLQGASADSGDSATLIASEGLEDTQPHYAHDVIAPQTDGSWVVWGDYFYHPHHPSTVIYAASLADKQPFQIGATGGPDYQLNDGIVVWSEGSAQYPTRFGIYGYDLARGTALTISTVAGYGPVLGDLGGGVRPVVWVERTSDDDSIDEWIVRCNLPCTAEPERLHQLPAGASVSGLALSGTQLYWQEEPNDGSLYPPIMTMALDETTAHVALASAARFVVDGPTLAYLGRPTDPGYELGVIDSADPARSGVIARYAASIALEGRYVFWTDARQTAESDSQRFELFGFDRETQSFFVAAAFSRDSDVFVWAPEQPSANRGMLTWVDQEQRSDVEVAPGYFTRYDSEVHAAPIDDLLPSAPRPAGLGDETQTYYPETGHYLGGGFRDYWNFTGGLPVFGYPLTEEYSYSDLTTGAYLTIQYFERQRYEWHPENHGTPYTVLLGRLTDELLARQGRSWLDFPTADPATPHYFPETKHAIDERFWAYWSTHGLEFGDAGTSFRESLALFGYPLSEPMTETNADGDTVLTQYFERAVFEYHPENAGTPYEVLLRRLGAEALAAQGW